MADRGAEFSFLLGIYVRTGIRIGISMSIKPMITKLGKQVHLQELTQMKVIKWILVTSSRQVYLTN